MSLFRIALLQLVPADNQQENLEKGLEYCRAAQSLGADLALFPEMWNIGYAFPPKGGHPGPAQGLREWTEQAIDGGGEFIARFKGRARELNMAIALTYLEKWPGLPRNTVTIIDRFGNSVLTYAKVHTCDFDDEKYCTPGDDFYTASLDTSGGLIKIGAMICYDREFPESARILMLQGAEIIIVPNACPIEENRRSQLKTRAFENMVGIAMANYGAGKHDCNGHSLAYDGIAWGESNSGAFGTRDTLLVEAGEAEGIYMAEFDMEGLRNYRRREAFGNAYRKPKKYSMLISEKVEEPFVRNDARR
jgi:predicted amidohydrolase